MANESCEIYDVVCFGGWLKDEFKSFFLYVYDSILSGLARLVELIPVPDFLANMHSFVMTSWVSWFIEPFEISYGLSAIVSAYIARFILRRIPGIG